MDYRINEDSDKGLIIGLDLKENSALLSVYDYDNKIIEPVEVDTRQEIYFNKSFSELIKNNSTYVDNDYEELTSLIRDFINMCSAKKSIYRIDSICVCLHTYDEEYLMGIKTAFDNLGIDSGKWQIISKVESFAYYAYSQKKELYLGGVCLLDFGKIGLNVYRLISKRSNNIDYIIEEHQLFDSPDFKDVICKKKTLDDCDEQLCAALNSFLNKRAVSTIYITGPGFCTDTLPQAFTKLIVSRRKAFMGQNLYTRGACYCALENICPNVFDNTVLLSEQRIMVGIELDILEQGKPKRFRLIRPGTNWFMADRCVDFIIEDMQQINLKILTADNRFDDEIIDISDFPYREGKTTRISIEVKFYSATRCQIVVKDLGFGDFFKSSGKVIYKDLDFAI